MRPRPMPTNSNLSKPSLVEITSSANPLSKDISRKDNQFKDLRISARKKLNSSKGLSMKTKNNNAFKRIKDNKPIEVWYDGACEPVNPGGHASFGALIKKNGETIWETSIYVGVGPGMSNNVAEYSGMIGVLEKLLEMGIEKELIHVRGDNMMTIQQMAGRWRAKGGLYIPYYEKCKALVRQFSRISFEWIPREQNTEADELSKQILEQKGIRKRKKSTDYLSQEYK